MTFRVGVFATEHGWRVAGPTYQQFFESGADALDAARRWAHLARWRGDEVEMLAQQRPGGPLVNVELPSPPAPAGADVRRG